LAKDAIAANGITSSSLHPNAASIDYNCCQQKPPLLWQPLTAASINDPPLPPLATNNNHWLLVVVDVDCVAAVMAVIDSSDSNCL
jgi:hypothetical protein